ncbi:MAG: hypothetical protein ABL931_07565 [Usitatibacteraceae bacterium]
MAIRLARTGAEATGITGEYLAAEGNKKRGNGDDVARLRAVE